jgi:hypothetical protein
VVVMQFEDCRPSAAKAEPEQWTYRSAEALRHPKSNAMASFSATSGAVAFQSRFELHHFAKRCTLYRGL